MIFTGKSNEFLSLASLDARHFDLLKEYPESSLTLIWFLEDNNHFVVDGQPCFFSKNQIVCLTEFHRVAVQHISRANVVRFNRPFFCVVDHDSEVGCKGILFFGASQLPVIDIPETELEKFETLWRMFNLEMLSKDSLQMEMLQMMLRRLLILCARLFKEQNKMLTLENGSLDIVREFNFLVETNFKTKRTVAEYANLLHKTPKTLSNYFAQYSPKTPLQIIQERTLLEARRLLHYTDRPVKEIADDVGFEDIQAFSRFFKGKEGVSPTTFRERVSTVEKLG